jgi:hypothetical protein
MRGRRARTSLRTLERRQQILLAGLETRHDLDLAPPESRVERGTLNDDLDAVLRDPLVPRAVGKEQAAPPAGMAHTAHNPVREASDGGPPQVRDQPPVRRIGSPTAVFASAEA